MPQAVLVAALPAAISGAAAVTGSVMGSRAQSRSSERALKAQQDAAAKAEAFEREQEEFNRAERARAESEESRRFNIQQANEARKQAQEDALLRDELARASYEDAIRYNKAVNIARLTGQPMPQQPPPRTAASVLTPQDSVMSRPDTGLVPTRASTSNALINGASIGAMSQRPVPRDPLMAEGQPGVMNAPLRLGDLAARRRQRQSMSR